MGATEKRRSTEFSSLLLFSINLSPKPTFSRSGRTLAHFRRFRPLFLPQHDHPVRHKPNVVPKKLHVAPETRHAPRKPLQRSGTIEEMWDADDEDRRQSRIGHHVRSVRIYPIRTRAAQRRMHRAPASIRVDRPESRSRAARALETRAPGTVTRSLGCRDRAAVAGFYAFSRWICMPPRTS